jgi:hypothetical protein
VPDHADTLHERAVLRLVVCRFRQSFCHLSKNIRETTRWRVFEANRKARRRATAKIFKNRMMSAANAPFIWLARLKKSAFRQAAVPPRPAAQVLDAGGLFAYTSAVPERIKIFNPRCLRLTGCGLRETRGFRRWRGAAN